MTTYDLCDDEPDNQIVRPDKRKIRRIRRPKHSGKITWAAAKRAVKAARGKRHE